MPAEQRAEFVREHHAKLARLAQLVDREQKIGLVDAAQFAVLFTLADVLSRSSSASTILLAFLVGSVLGYVSSTGSTRSTPVTCCAWDIKASSWPRRGG